MLCLIYSFGSNFADDKLDSSREAERNVSRVVSRRDMATQMSPERSNHSSPKGRSSFSAFPLPVPTAAQQHNSHSAKVEVIRDVQVDKRATVTRQSKKHGTRRRARKKSSDFKDLASQWDVSGAVKTSSRSYLFLIRQAAKTFSVFLRKNMHCVSKIWVGFNLTFH